jgi:hypothetical protein
MSAPGHEEPFPPTGLSAGCGFRKETIAGMRRNGRDAPIPDLPALAPERGGSTRSCRSPPVDMGRPCIRRFGAKPDKKIVDRSSGEPEFMEDAFHCNSDGLVVGVDRFLGCAPRVLRGELERRPGGV